MLATARRFRRGYRRVRRIYRAIRNTTRATAYRRRKNVGNSPYATSMQPVLFRNSIEVGLTANATPANGTGYGRTFKFDDIADVTEIMALYDQYQIHSIDIKYIPGIVTADGATNWHTPMYVAFDPMDGSAPASAAEMLDYANVKKKDPFKEWKMTIVPQFFQSIGVVASNEYTTVPSTSLWMSNTDTVCYGLRIWFDPVNVANAQLGTLVFTYNVLARFQS